MADGDDGGSRAQMIEQAVKRCFGVFVERRGAFVDEDHVGLLQQYATEGETLLFADGEALRPVVFGVEFVRQFAKSYCRKRFFHLRVHHAFGLVRVEQGGAQRA